MRLFLYMSESKTAYSKLANLFDNFVDKIELEETPEWTNEHKILYLIRHDLPFKEVLERNNLLIIDGDAMRPLFLDDMEAVDMFKTNTLPEYSLKYKRGESTDTFYRRLLKLKGVASRHADVSLMCRQLLRSPIQLRRSRNLLLEVRRACREPLRTGQLADIERVLRIGHVLLQERSDQEAFEVLHTCTRPES